MDLIITNGTVVTMDPDLGVIQEGAVAVAGGSIVWVGAGPYPGACPGARVIDARGGIVMPGLINCMAGVGSRIPPRATGPAGSCVGAAAGSGMEEERQDRLALGARLACAEMLLSGTTCFCDRIPVGAGIAEVAAQAGIRAVLCREESPPPADQEDRSQGCGSGTGMDGMAAGLRESATSPVPKGVSFRNLGDWPSRALADGFGRCRGLGMVISLPCHGSVAGALQPRAGAGRSIPAFLEALGLFGPGLLLTGGTDLEGMDLDLLAKRGCALVHTPLADMKQSRRQAPVPELLEGGGLVCLGTGSDVLSPDLDLFRTMDLTAKIHKVVTGNPEVAGAESVLAMATVNGARALGRQDHIGSLTPGKRADLIVVDTSALHLRPMYSPVSHLVYAASGRDVLMTLVEGRVVMERGKLPGMDLGSVMDRARALGLFPLKGDDGEDVQVG